MPGLAIRVWFHDGRYHGAGDWPPAPARLFQALVAGAALGRHLDPVDQAALTWLEQQAAPIIAAPRAVAQKSHITYVPNNDLDAVGGDPAQTIRVGKTVRPMLFDPAIPLIYLWDVQDVDGAAVVALAARLHHLGRGTDPAWAEASVLSDDGATDLIAQHSGPIHRPVAPGGEGWPVPMPGSLASLQRRHDAWTRRFARIGQGRAAVTGFTQPPKALFAHIRYDAAPVPLLFDLSDGVGPGFHAVPSRQAGALVGRLIDRAAARLGADDPQVARLVMGRGAGPADLAQRIRVFALPTLRTHVDRAIRRVVVEVPQSCPLRADDVAWAFAGLSPLEQAPAMGEAFAPALVRADDDGMLQRYCQPARLWRSETPLALAAARRRIAAPTPAPKPGSERAAEEAAARTAIAAALRHAGITARPLRIAVQREPFAAQGTGAEAFAPGTRFSPHALWHAEIAFAEPLQGPLILGDGRFLGLGLMVPQRDAPGIVAFAIQAGLERPDPATLAQALRRATIARAAAILGRDKVPAFFCGHEADGSPSRTGAHRHLAFVADPARGLLLLVPPHVFDRRAPDRDEWDHLRMLERLATGFTDLRAGACGALTLARIDLDADDPLLAPATTWVSRTPYRLTRHPKRQSFAEALAEDIAREAARRGLAIPRVALLARGPDPQTAQVRLHFATAQPGPILLGQSLHQGGGLFAGEAR